jgi:hypothetical protein
MPWSGVFEGTVCPMRDGWRVRRPTLQGRLRLPGNSRPARGLALRPQEQGFDRAQVTGGVAAEAITLDERVSWRLARGATPKMASARHGALAACLPEWRSLRSVATGSPASSASAPLA